MDTDLICTVIIHKYLNDIEYFQITEELLFCFQYRRELHPKIKLRKLAITNKNHHKNHKSPYYTFVKIQIHATYSRSWQFQRHF